MAELTMIDLNFTECQIELKLDLELTLEYFCSTVKGAY